jgi:hypothetical protein
MMNRIALLLAVIGLLLCGTGCIVPVPGHGGGWHHGWERGHHDWR